MFSEMLFFVFYEMFNFMARIRRVSGPEITVIFCSLKKKKKKISGTGCLGLISQVVRW